MKDLHAEKHMTMIKEIHESVGMEIYTMLLDWRVIINMDIKSKAIYNFNANPYQNTHDIFHRRINNLKIWCQSFSHVLIFVTSWTVECQAPPCPWSSPGKNTGMGSHYLLQWSSQPRYWTLVLHFRQILYRLSNQGRLKINMQLRKAQNC